MRIESKIPLVVQGIQCDNPQCTFKEENIPFEDYAEWLERPCPECGEILLTEEDFNTLKLLMSISAIANNIDKKE